MFSWKFAFVSLSKASKHFLGPALPNSCWGHWSGEFWDQVGLKRLHLHKVCWNLLVFIAKKICVSDKNELALAILRVQFFSTQTVPLRRTILPFQTELEAYLESYQISTIERSCPEPCVTLKYLELWHIQNLRNIQSPAKHLWCRVFLRALYNPDIFRTLLYSKPWDIF